MKTRIITGIIGGSLFLSFLFLGDIYFSLLVGLLALIGLYELYKMSTKEKNFSFKKVLIILFGISYIVIGFFYFWQTRENYDVVVVLTILFIIWTTDSAAYFVGKAFGKTKLAPSISPNKTIEGSLGGVFFAVIIGFVMQEVFELFSSWSDALLIFVLASVIGQLGDLIESSMKRYFDIKDSGNILPGHGGVLDRFDSLLLVFPVIYLLFL